ncbi:Uncharacterised protein [Escherichia coli]|nr:Uncharacterised protein [Escherichia coli]VVZ83380.1 Uncharacterised protein [Escherichia coli]
MPFQQPAVKDFYRAYPARLTADRQRVSVGFAVAMQVALIAFKLRLADLRRVHQPALLAPCHER